MKDESNRTLVTAADHPRKEIPRRYAVNDSGSELRYQKEGLSPKGVFELPNDDAADQSYGGRDYNCPYPADG